MRAPPCSPLVGGYKKTTPASGGRLVFAFGFLRAPKLQASLPAEMWAITPKKGDQVLRHQNRSGALERCGPIPPRASSIDLKDSEHLMQPDHDTSSDVGAGPSLLRSAEHLCSTPAPGGRVKRPSRMAGPNIFGSGGVARSASDPQQIADLARNDLHVGPPRLLRVDAGRGGRFDEQGDGAPEVRQANDLGRECARVLA